MLSGTPLPNRSGITVVMPCIQLIQFSRNPQGFIFIMCRGRKCKRIQSHCLNLANGYNITYVGHFRKKAEQKGPWKEGFCVVYSNGRVSVISPFLRSRNDRVFCHLTTSSVFWMFRSSKEKSGQLLDHFAVHLSIPFFSGTRKFIKFKCISTIWVYNIF